MHMRTRGRRFEDYQAGVKNASTGPAQAAAPASPFGGTGAFGAPAGESVCACVCVCVCV